MKRAVPILVFLVVSCIPNPVFAETKGGQPNNTAFDRTVADLKSDRTQRIVRSAKDGIEVACTLLPARKALAIGWEINNPGRKEVDIKADDIRVFDQIRGYYAMTPGEAAQTLFGTRSKPATADPFMDAAAPSSYAVPAVGPGSKDAEDVILSAFNFVKTDSARSSGLLYYAIYGKKAKVTVTMNIDGETLEFEFN
jgi:hypothetical protein